MAAIELNKSVIKDVFGANLKAYYRFESGALTTDSSGNGYTLTNSNSVTSSTGVFGGGADFGISNSNKSLTVTNNLGIDGGACTISAWVKLSSEISTDYFAIVSQQSTTSKVKYAVVYNYNGGTRRIEFWRVKNGVSVDGPTYTITLGTNSWYHIVLTYDATSVRGYINGQFVGVAASSGNGSAAVSSFLNIGCDDSGIRYFSGLIDDVSIFNTALCADQIKELYEGRIIGEGWPTASTVGLWHLSSETDCGPNAYHLTNNGTTTFVAGKYIKAGSFNGSSQSLTATAANTQMTGSRTYLAWVYPTSLATADKTIMGRSNSAGSLLARLHIMTTGKVAMQCTGVKATNGGAIESTATVSTNNWYFVAGVFDQENAKIKVWVNGQKTEDATTSTSTETTGVWAIGKLGNYTGNNYFQGLIDEARVENRAWTDQEIRNYYAWASGRFTNIV